MATSRARGFTLIELMIVIATLGILIAITLPAFQDYSIRARNTECLAMASKAKAAVGEGLHILDGFSAERTAFQGAPTRYCAAIEINDDGVITAATQNTGAAPPAIFELVPTRGTAAIEWECTETNGAAAAQLPAACRP